MAKSLFPDKVQISVLTKLEKEFKDFCKEDKIKIRKVTMAGSWTIFEYKKEYKEQILYIVKQTYESYLIEEVFNK